MTAKAAQEESAWVLQWLVVLTLAGAAVIHADQIGVHLEEWLPAGLTFIGLAFVQMGLAAAILLWPSRGVYAASLVVSVLTVVLWTVSRSAGLPFGPEAGEPETVGRPDLIASGLEVVTACAALAVLAGLRSGVRRGKAITVSFVSAVAIGVALLTWAAVVSPEASSHEDPQSLTGPLVPSRPSRVRDSPQAPGANQPTRRP